MVPWLVPDFDLSFKSSGRHVTFRCQSEVFLIVKKRQLIWNNLIALVLNINIYITFVMYQKNCMFTCFGLFYTCPLENFSMKFWPYRTFEGLYWRDLKDISTTKFLKFSCLSSPPHTQPVYGSAYPLPPTVPSMELVLCEERGRRTGKWAELLEVEHTWSSWKESFINVTEKKSIQRICRCLYVQAVSQPVCIWLNMSDSFFAFVETTS